VRRAKLNYLRTRKGKSESPRHRGGGL